MAPLYEVVMMTKSGKGATVQLTSLLQNCAKSLWSRGAVLADIRPWGARDLAYRIRKQSENHYSAQYVSMDVYCSPPTLHRARHGYFSSRIVRQVVSSCDWFLAHPMICHRW
jgi:small subunit ribosomal protein S6